MSNNYTTQETYRHSTNRASVQTELLDRMLSGQATWQLTSTPPQRFYAQLHSHLKRKGNLSKGEMGALHIKLEPHFKTYRSDNAYRVIDKMCKAETLDHSAAMTYYNETSPRSSTQCQGSKQVGCTETPNSHYLKKNIDKREARKDKKLEKLQQSFRETSWSSTSERCHCNPKSSHSRKPFLGHSYIRNRYKVLECSKKLT